MFAKDELLNGIYEISQGKHSIQNCEKLAAIYTVMDHLYPNNDILGGYSRESAPIVEPQIGNYGNTEFLQAIQGKDARQIWHLMDELMSTISVINPRLYESVLRKI